MSVKRITHYTHTHTHTTPSQITITLTHHYHHHSQTPKYLQPSSDSPNTQSAEPERTSNELRSSLSLPLPQRSFNSKNPATHYTHSHSHTHNQPNAQPIRSNHPQPALSQLSMGARRTSFVAQSLCPCLSPISSSSALS